jgi:outer membrane protein assembly factor BamB
VNLDTAEIIWSRRLGDVISAASIRGDILYVGGVDGLVHALNSVDGSDAWLAPFNTGDGPVKLVIFPHRDGGNLFFTTDTTVWSIVDNGDGTASENWRRSDIMSPSAPSTWTGSSYAYVGSSDGNLHELDVSSGADVDLIPLGDPAPGSIAAVGAPSVDLRGNLLYVGSEAGIVYAVALP